MIKRVIIVNNVRRLKIYLKDAGSHLDGEKVYLSWDKLPIDIKERLEKAGFKYDGTIKHDERYRNYFVREYNDVIGSIAQVKDQSKLWWATDMASKNRFMSQLPRLLQQFGEIMNAAHNDLLQHVVVIGPSWAIQPSLRKNLEKENVELIYLGKGSKKEIHIASGIVRKMASLIYHAARIYLRICYAQMRLKKILKEKLDDKKHYYVVRSFIYDHSLTDGRYADPFFGRLPEFLKKTKDVLIFCDILGNYKSCIRKIETCKAGPIIPYEIFLSFFDVARAVLQILFCKIMIPNETLFFRNDVSDIIKNELVRTFNGIAIYQLLNYSSTMKLLKRVSTVEFLLTFENNPWEKMSMAAIREFSPRTKIIGYQHNVVPQASVNMFIGSMERPITPKPDIILTTGANPRDIMLRYGDFEGISFDTACALRYEYLFRLNPAQKPQEHRSILLALEGIFESYHMVNYVLGQLSNDTKYKVKVRTHPVLPLKIFKHKLDFDLKAMRHVSFSKGTNLKDDIESSDIVMYWGSTVALEALWMGKPVIHFDNGNILSFDPLFDCSHLKWTVSRDKDLGSVLKEIDLLDPEEYEHQKTEAKTYLQHYFYPVTDENLSHFLA